MNDNIYDEKSASEAEIRFSDDELHSYMADEARLFRSGLLRCGYLPVPLVSAKKKPREPEWHIKARARAGQTEWIEPVTADNWNTGIMCDGLYAVDVDVDDPDLADEVSVELENTLGISPARRVRRQSPRYLALYRAEGEPRKQAVGIQRGNKVEILGLGQQCMVHGLHPLNGYVEWITPHGRSDDGLMFVPREVLPLVHQSQVDSFLDRCRGVFGIDICAAAEAAAGSFVPVNREQSGFNEDDIADIITHLPADTGYDDWVTVLSAIYNATNGAGMHLADAYSAKSYAYSPTAVAQKWRSFRHGGVLHHDFGYLVNRVREVVPGYMTPSFRAKLSAVNGGYGHGRNEGLPADQVIMDTDF